MAFLDLHFRYFFLVCLKKVGLGRRDAYIQAFFLACLENAFSVKNQCRHDGLMDGSRQTYGPVGLALPS